MTYFIPKAYNSPLCFCVVPLMPSDVQNNETLQEESLSTLLQYYDVTDAYMEPVLAAFRAEESAVNNTSPWAEHAQFVIADLAENEQSRLVVSIDRL